MSTEATAGLAPVSTETTQIHRIYIKASAQAIWDAITTPEWSQRYGYGGHVHYDLRPGGAFTVNPDDKMLEGAKQMGFELPEVILDGEVLECDPPKRLVQTWRMIMDPESMAEGFTRLTYEITELDGACRLTLTHELEGAPHLRLLVGGAYEDGQGGGGFPWVLSDLKSLLETGAGLAG